MPSLKSLDAVRPSVTVLVGLVLLAAILSIARSVLIPIALAILLAFILAPAVTALQRRRLSRTSAVIVVVLVAFLVIGAGTAAITSELHDLAADLPTHRDNILSKVKDLRQGPGVIEGLAGMLDEIEADVQPKSFKIPVSIQGESRSGLETVSSMAEPLVSLVGSVGLVIAMTITILFKREDLRNRLIRLAGHRQLTSTTRAMDEATRRISSYLVIQVAINTGFGAVMAAGLALLGVPYSLMWGVLGIILRFIPYIGTWLAILPPVLVSLAVSADWFQPSAVALFGVAIGLLVNNLIEPLLVSRTTGVSPLALVVAAAFWTWLWGPIGLVLSTPMTVCLRVLGRYVPPLEFLDILFGNEPALDPRFGYYQRLLARDDLEAGDVLDTYLQDHDRLQLCDDVLVPTLVGVKDDLQQGNLLPEDVEFILSATRDWLEDRTAEAEPAAESRRTALVLGCPARDEIDTLALQLFEQLAEPDYQVERLGTGLVAAEVLEQVRQQQPAWVLIAAIPPGGLARIRYLCKKLRGEFASLPIAIGLWGQPDDDGKLIDSLLSAGATQVATSMSDSLRHLRGFSPIVPAA